MPSRLSAIFSRSSKEQEAKAEEAANQERGESSDPVPEYSTSQIPPPPDYSLNDDGDDAPPDYTAGFATLSISDAPSLENPQASETIAHLKTLECFYRLKQRIASTDGLFGIDNSKVIDIARESNLDKAGDANEFLPKLAEKRWAVYVSRAVDRFHAWVSVAVPIHSLPTVDGLEQDGRNGSIMEPSYVKRVMPPLGTHNMPPVDVLMVWHAYMLNPRAYLDDCIRHGRMGLWNMRMPWNAVAGCINPSTFAFEADPAAEGAFTRLTGRYWDNLVDGDVKTLACPNCQTEASVPWSTCCDYIPDDRQKPLGLGDNVDVMLASGTGFCDRNFREMCAGCGTTLTHDVIRAGRFCVDVKELLSNQRPLPGTILGLRGIPIRYEIYRDIHWVGVYKTTHRLLSLGLGQKILDQPSLKGEGLNQSMSRIRDMIGETISGDKEYMRTVRHSGSQRMTRLERVGFRKMMGNYWNNSSPFALDLVGAVVRQGGFVEKMHNIDWLHSPALPSTMTRLILKYDRFAGLMEDATQMAVPTLDVDLAWHTHQLNPPSYFRYMVKKVRQFVDHDDKVAETELNDAFAWTSKTYEKKYGDKYSECTCWYCEAIREQSTSASAKLFSSKGKGRLYGTEQDPSKFVHISAHNAVNPTDDPKYTAEARAQADKLEAAYQKACDRAKKKGDPVPNQSNLYWSSAYGYPVLVTGFVVPFSAAYYVASPGCMTLAQGGAGSCAAGTCSGAVTAGACGAGHCVGGTTGGCGGGATLGGGCSGGGGAACGGGGGGGGGC